MNISNHIATQVPLPYMPGVIAVLLMILGCSSANAQSVGASIDIGRASPYVQIPVFQDCPSCTRFSNGTLSSSGFDVFTSLESIVSSRIGLTLIVGSDLRSYSFDADADEPIWLWDSMNASVVRLDPQYHLRLQRKSLTVALLLRLRVAGWLHAELGPTLDLQLSSTLDRSVRQSNGNLPADPRSREFVTGRSIEQPSSLIPGVQLGVPVSIPLPVVDGLAVVLRPYIVWTPDLEGMESWERLRYGGMGGLKFDFSRIGVSEQPPPPVPVTARPDERGNPQAELVVHGVTPDGSLDSVATVTMYQLVNHNCFDGTCSLDTTNRFAVPALTFEPGYNAPRGLKEWKITVEFHGETITQRSSSDAGAISISTWEPEIAVLTSGDPRLKARFILLDSSDAEAVAEASIPLEFIRITRSIYRVAATDGKIIYVPYDDSLDLATHPVVALDSTTGISAIGIGVATAELQSRLDAAASRLRLLSGRMVGTRIVGRIQELDTALPDDIQGIILRIEYARPAAAP